MRRPAAEWDEQYILSLPVGEDDRLERKGARLLDLTIPGVREEAVRDELAKQLSAFGNTGGGNLIYGLTDAGAIDSGGVSRTIKGRATTKAWVEDLIPMLTDYEIIGVNVYEIVPSTQNSQIQAGKALYIVDIPDSDRAPHQSTRDLRYYVRLAGESQPASHRLIEDIRNRARHPNVCFDAKVVEVGVTDFQQQPPGQVNATFYVIIRFILHNKGPIKATDACLQTEIGLDVPMSACLDLNIVQIRGVPPTLVFWEVQHPLYPEMDISFRGSFPFSASLVPGSRSSWLLQSTSEDVSEIGLRWKVFADSAPPKSGVVTMAQMGLAPRLQEALEKHAGWRSLGLPS